MKNFLFENADLTNLLGSLYKTKLPMPLSRKVMALAVCFDVGASALKEERMKLQNEYGVKGEDGKVVIKDGTFTIIPEKGQEYADKFNTLMQTNYAMPQLTASELNGFPSLSAEELKMLIDSGLAQNSETIT